MVGDDVFEAGNQADGIRKNWWRIRRDTYRVERGSGADHGMEAGRPAKLGIAHQWLRSIDGTAAEDGRGRPQHCLSRIREQGRIGSPDLVGKDLRQPTRFKRDSRECLCLQDYRGLGSGRTRDYHPYGHTGRNSNKELPIFRINRPRDDCHCAKTGHRESRL